MTSGRTNAELKMALQNVESTITVKNEEPRSTKAL